MAVENLGASRFSLALGVEQKVREGRELNAVEAGVLNLCITRVQLRFIHRNGLRSKPKPKVLVGEHNEVGDL